jgi:hypothetical protein
MKLSIRIVVLSVVIAATAAAATTPKTASPVVSSRQSATSFMPLPTCGNGQPWPCN